MHSSINADYVIRGLALAVARNAVGAMRPVYEIITAEGITQPEYDAISVNPQFTNYVDSYTSELKSNGFSFAAKSRLLAEDLLPTAYHMARDMDTPAAVRAKIIENFVDWGDLKPKNSAISAAGPGFSITINIPSTANSVEQTLVLEAESTEINPQIAENVQKPAILLLEDEEYEYAGDDYL